mmetsp:Transcript_1033/g.3217  ORF Transcript_1033/g.3217 Transcript_1033/m.3217 type:complete len:94 (-) Transcript_1033:159-440(-)
MASKLWPQMTLPWERRKRRVTCLLKRLLTVMVNFYREDYFSTWQQITYAKVDGVDKALLCSHTYVPEIFAPHTTGDSAQREPSFGGFSVAQSI